MKRPWWPFVVLLLVTPVASAWAQEKETVTGMLVQMIGIAAGGPTACS